VSWIKANGGPLAIVVVGLSVAGYTNPLAGWILVGVGFVAWAVVIGYRRSPWQIVRKSSAAGLGGVSPPALPAVPVSDRETRDAELLAVRLIAGEIAAGKETTAYGIGRSQMLRAVDETNWNAHHHTLSMIRGAGDAYRLASAAYDGFAIVNDAISGRKYISDGQLGEVMLKAHKAEVALSVLDQKLDRR